MEKVKTLGEKNIFLSATAPRRRVSGRGSERTPSLPATALALALASSQAKHHRGCGARGAIGVAIIVSSVVVAIAMVIIIKYGGPHGMSHKRHILFRGFRGQ